MRAAYTDALGKKKVSKHSAPRKRVIHMQRSDTLHDPQIGFRYRSRLGVNPTPADAEDLRLAYDWELVVPIDHRLPLSRPALLSVPF